MADGNRVNFRFPDVENYFDNLGANKSTTSPEQITQMVGNLFDNPNLMTNSIAELKNIMTADSQSSQNLMKQYTEKMDTLITTLQQNVDYSKRIADGIA
jgi:Spy/CpxP family protein refolding chaperone